MVRRIKETAAFVLLAFCLAGCGARGEDAAESSVVEVKKDGSVLNTIKGSFSEEDHGDEDALKDFILHTAAEYNESAGEDRISVKKVKAANDRAELVLEYQTADDFGAFNEYSFFCGTVEEAYEAGYDLDQTYEDAGGGESITRDELLTMGSRRIVIGKLIKDEALTVKASGKILYCAGDSVREVSGDRAQIEGDQTFWLIYK